MENIARNRITALPCSFMLAHISRKQSRGGDEMSKESVQISLVALPLIITLLFMYLAEQKIKTVGELISFLVSKTQFFINFISNTSLIFIALIVTFLIFIGFLVFNRKK